jgi:hypothetical protein
VILSIEIVLLGFGVYKSVPPVDQLTWPISCLVLRWVGLGGLLGGAARAFVFLKADFNGDTGREPQWCVDRWSFYVFKPALGAAGGLASYLGGYLAFTDSFTDLKVGLVRVLFAALAGGMFFEDAFSQLKGLRPKKGPPKNGPPNSGQ